MQYTYNCDKCGSTIMAEGTENSGFCPFCDETPAERRLRERAEAAEAERDQLKNYIIQLGYKPLYGSPII